MKASFTNSFSLLSSSVFAKVVGIFVIAFVARAVSKEELAVIPIYLMLGELVISGLSMGVFPIFVRNLPGLISAEKGKAKSFFITGSLIVFGGSLLMSLLIWYQSELLSELIFDEKEKSGLIRLMCVGFVALSIRRINENLLTSRAEFKSLSFLQFIEAIFKSANIFIFIYLFGGQGLIYALLLNEVFISFMAMFFNIEFFLYESGKRYPFYTLLKRSLPFYLETYLMYFRTQGDNWIITTYLGAKAMAVYYIAKIVYATLFMLFQSIDKVFTQKIAGYKHDVNFIIDSIPRMMNVILCTGVPFVLLTMSLTPALVYVIAGETYTAAVLPAMILCIVVMVYFIRMPIGRALFVLSPPSTRLKITLLETVVLIPLLVYMAPAYEAVGVAFSLLISMIIGGVFTYVLLRRHVLFKYDILLTLKLVMMIFVPQMLLIVIQNGYMNLYVIPIYILSSTIITYVVVRYYSPLNFGKTIGDILPVDVRNRIKIFL